MQFICNRINQTTELNQQLQMIINSLKTITNTHFQSMLKIFFKFFSKQFHNKFENFKNNFEIKKNYE